MGIEHDLKSQDDLQKMRTPSKIISLRIILKLVNTQTTTKTFLNPTVVIIFVIQSQIELRA